MDTYLTIQRERVFNLTNTSSGYLPVQLTQHNDTDPITLGYTLTDCGVEGVYYSCCTR